MHKHGGMYADLDMEALRDLSPLLKGNTEPVFAALMDDPPNNFRHNIPNAWMASPAGHPFWQVRAPIRGSSRPQNEQYLASLQRCSSLSSLSHLVRPVVPRILRSFVLRVHFMMMLNSIICLY